MQIAILSSPHMPTDRLIQALEESGMTPCLVSAEDSHTAWAKCTGVILLSYPEGGNHTLLTALENKNRSGDPILGIGEGAKWLVDTGLAPGLENDKAAIQWVQGSPQSIFKIHVASAYQYNAYTRLLNAESRFTISHEGSADYFQVPPALLIEMTTNGLAVFYYENSDKIAAVSNKAGNVMAIAPSIEYADARTLIFESMREYIKKGYRQQVRPLYYYPRG